MRLAKRLAVDLAESPWAKRVALARAAGDVEFDLTNSNPLTAGFATEPTWALSYARALSDYPTPRKGLLAAREAVTRYYSQRSANVDPSRIQMGASVSEIYSALLMTLCDPGDAILVPRPSYPLLQWLARFVDVRVLPYSLVYASGWRVDIHDVRDAIAANVKAVIAFAPNNPTGQYLSVGEWRALNEQCCKHDLALIVDEVFTDYALTELPPGKLRTALAEVDDSSATTVIISGLSKVAALPQMKLAWCAVAGRDADLLLSRLEMIAPTYLTPAPAAQTVMSELFAVGEKTRADICLRLHENLDQTQRSCAGTWVSALAVEAGWNVTLKLPNLVSEARWMEALLAAGVLVQPGSFYDFHGGPHIVLSLLTEPRLLEAALVRIHAVASTLALCTVE